VSVVWHDTPAYYSTSTIADHWDVVVDMAVDANDGYDGGPALTGDGATGYAIQDCDGFPGGLTFARGRRFKATSLPSADTIIFGVTGALRELRVIVVCLTDGRLAVYRGDREQLLAVTSSAIATSTQMRLGLSGTLGAGTAGAVRLDIDGETVATAAGVDTGADIWRGVLAGGTAAMFASHEYAADDGIHRPGYLVEYTPADNANLDDTDHDGDSTVENLDVDESISEPLDTPVSRRSIYGVRTIAVVKNFDPAGWEPHLTLNGTLYEADRQPILSTFSAVSQFYATNPATGAPFTGAEIIDADLEIGGKAVA
jgi:hypothetical protein